MRTIEDRIMSAYYRSFPPYPYIYQQPSGDIDWREDNGREYGILTNCNGFLACYEVLPSGRVRHVDIEDLPESIAKEYADD